MNDAWSIPQTMHWAEQQEGLGFTEQRTPYHRQLILYFNAMIESGALKPGAKLPSERILSDKFSITRVTVRQALSRLEAEGLVYREQRRGWFISPPRILYDPTLNTSFTENIAKQERTLVTSVQFKRQIISSAWLSSILKCELGAAVFAVNRKKSVDGRVVMVEQLYIKASSCPGLLDCQLERSMTDILAEKYGMNWLRRKIIMRPTALSDEPAKSLRVAAGTPSLYLSRLLLDQSNEVIEFDQEFWRHDAIEICVSASLNSSETA